MKKIFFTFFVSFLVSLSYAHVNLRDGEIVINRSKSSFQEDTTNILTLSTGLERSDSITIIFILPVERIKEKYKFGSGIKEVKELLDSNLINKNIVFVQPEFIRVPWYGNHPSNNKVWQEKYLIKIIEDVSL